VPDEPTAELTEPAPPATPAPAAGLNHIQQAVLSLVLAGVLVAGVALGPIATAIAVGVVQLVLVPSWVLGNQLPGRIGAILLGLLAAAAADAAVLHWHQSGYSPVLGVLALAVPLMFAHQLVRGVVRTRVVESLAGITILVIGMVAIAGLVVLRYEADGRTIGLAVTLALGIALIVSHLADAALPAPRFDPSMDRGLPGVLLGVVAGAVVGYLITRNLIDFAGGRSIFLGGAVGAVACLLSIGASFADPSAVGRRHPARAAEETTEAAPAGPGPSRLLRLRPAGSVALTVALTVPAAYVLTNALTS